MPRSTRHRSLLAAACLAALVWAGCGSEEAPPELPPRAILWQRVGDVSGAHLRVISGIVTAVSDTQLAFEVGGIVDTVEVNLGDTVEKDQVLASLDPEPFELSVRDAEAALTEARAKRGSAEADYQRYKALFEQNVTSRQEFERYKARRDSLEGQVDAAVARLNIAKRDLRRSVLRSPFAGSISVREIDPAMKVAGGQVVFEMDSGESGLRVEVQMPETLIARIRQGDQVEVTFPSGQEQLDEEERGRRYHAVVSEVGTRAGAGNSFPVRADFEDAPDWLRPGMTAEVRFEFGREPTGVAEAEGFLLPLAAAVIEEGGKFSVFVYDPDTSTVSLRHVETRGVRDNDFSVIGGLEPGEIVATAGVSFLREGQEVRLIDRDLVRNAP